LNPQRKVVRVDPAGFLKVSALGIEEQRVRVTIDFADPPEIWTSLGHDYRVVVHVTTWSASEALAVPVSALFRKGDQWAVFADDNGRAKTVPVSIGHRNNRMAEVLSGLAAGDRVVLHPSDRISDGSKIAQREGRREGNADGLGWISNLDDLTPGRDDPAARRFGAPLEGVRNQT
jgi:HlyD family secretion protein